MAELQETRINNWPPQREAVTADQQAPPVSLESDLRGKLSKVITSKSPNPKSLDGTNLEAQEAGERGMNLENLPTRGTWRTRRIIKRPRTKRIPNPMIDGGCSGNINVEGSGNANGDRGGGEGDWCGLVCGHFVVDDSDVTRREDTHAAAVNSLDKISMKDEHRQRGDDVKGTELQLERLHEVKRGSRALGSCGDHLHNHHHNGIESELDTQRRGGRWSIEGVRIWLNGLGLGRYWPVFEVHEVDYEVLPMLTLEDLKDMGISAVGTRRRMFSAIQKLSKGFS